MQDFVIVSTALNAFSTLLWLVIFATSKRWPMSQQWTQSRAVLRLVMVAALAIWGADVLDWI